MDDSLESWLHELEMGDPCTLFPEVYSQKMCDSSSSSGVEITEKQKERSDELAEKLYHDYQSSIINNIKADPNSMAFSTSVSSSAGVSLFSNYNNDLLEQPLSFQLLTGNYNNSDLRCQKKPKPARNSSPSLASTKNWIELDGQLAGGTWRNKVTPLPLPHHIVVERKRRQDLNHRFLALSKVVPGNKKRDKASILGEAVKYMTDLQERIKKLEEKSKKKVVESVVFVQRSSSSYSSTTHQYLPYNNNNNNNNGNYCYTMASYGGGQSNDDNFSNVKGRLLPEIEAKVIVRERSVLIRVHCENGNGNGKGILPTLLTEMPKLHLVLVTTNVVPLGNDTDITLIAQMGDDFCMKTKDIVEYLRLALPNFI